MSFYIVRHPETEYNRKDITQGHDDSSLTKEGKRIAQYLGKSLRNRSISKIYTSDLGRCFQTSEMINKELKLEIIPKKELREQNFGDFNGKRKEIILKNFDISNPDLVMPNGESFNQMKKRVLDFIKNIKESNSILIVTHDGVLRAILSEFSFLKSNTNSDDIFMFDKEENKITKF